MAAQPKQNDASQRETADACQQIEGDLAQLRQAYSDLASVSRDTPALQEIRNAMGQMSQLLAQAGSGQLGARDIGALRASINIPSISALISQAASTAADHTALAAAQAQAATVQMAQAQKELGEVSHSLFGADGKGAGVLEQYMHFDSAEDKRKWQEDHATHANIAKWGESKENANDPIAQLVVAESGKAEVASAIRNNADKTPEGRAKIEEKLHIIHDAEQKLRKTLHDKGYSPEEIEKEMDKRRTEALKADPRHFSPEQIEKLSNEMKKDAASADKYLAGSDYGKVLQADQLYHEHLKAKGATLLTHTHDPAVPEFAFTLNANQGLPVQSTNAVESPDQKSTQAGSAKDKGINVTLSEEGESNSQNNFKGILTKSLTTNLLPKTAIAVSEVDEANHGLNVSSRIKVAGVTPG